MAEKSSELEVVKAEVTSLTKPEYEENDDLATIYSKDESADESSPDDAVQIREQIEETRSQMSETIDAIQSKLSVANITEQVKDQVSEQIGTAVETAKDALYDKTFAVAKNIGRSLADIGNSDLAKKTQENPWLTSVIGMGIGAALAGVLFGGGQKRKKKVSSDRYKNFDDEHRSDDIRYTKQTRQKFRSREAGEAAYQTTRDRIGETAQTAYESVGSAAGKTYESVGKASNFAYEKAGDLGGEMKKKYEYYIEENPLVVGAVAFALGAAIGYAIPSTQVENQYLGEVRDNVIEKAQASAQDAIGTVKQVVGEAQQMIVEEVKSQTAS